MAWTARDIPDLHGLTALVTGPTSGLGLETARLLASGGARVLLAARDAARAEEVRRRIVERHPGAELEVRECDLASLASVRACADGARTDHPRLDVLVNNAGVMAVPERATADGFEMQLGVNHLAHFVLTARLLPALRAAPAGRVVTVTSFARLTGTRIDPANPHSRGRYDPWRAYGTAKRANFVFALELDRRLRRAGSTVRSLAAHPGLSHTDLQTRSVRESGGGKGQRFWALAARVAGMPPERGALPQVRAATDPDARGGDLYAPRWGIVGPPVRRPLPARPLHARAGTVLWEVSERETGERFAVQRRTIGG